MYSRVSRRLARAPYHGCACRRVKLMDVYWLDQAEAEVPEANDWLSPTEVTFLEGLRFAKRRTDWRLGRWTAKRALAIYFDYPDSASDLAKIEIRPASSGAPEVFFNDTPAAVTISLSHRNGKAICAVAPGISKLGCDLELIEPRSDAFVADYFTAEEQAQVMRHSRAEQPRLITLVWSAKESALKALGQGLRLYTRCVIVGPVDASLDVSSWSALDVHSTGGQILQGWWRITEDMVRTLVADPPPASPISLGNGDFDAPPRSFLRPRALSNAKRSNTLPIGR
jgi:4'-phosphopantetheinyl transferase